MYLHMRDLSPPGTEGGPGAAVFVEARKQKIGTTCFFLDSASMQKLISPSSGTALAAAQTEICPRQTRAR